MDRKEVIDLLSPFYDKVINVRQLFNIHNDKECGIQIGMLFERLQNTLQNLGYFDEEQEEDCHDKADESFECCMKDLSKKLAKHLLGKK